LVFSFITPSVSKAQTIVPGQEYVTSNIVQPTVPYSGTTPWTNGVYQNNLTCWGSGDPGYCGPNAIVRPGNLINFSFGTTNLYQIQSIANVLPNSGSGLRVNGYNFSFTAKNGNGWDDGRLDYLTAYTSFYASDGSLVYNKNYDLNYRFNWTTFNYSESFNTPHASKDLGSVQYGFVGRDNNFWAGPYGPEIYNVSFSLKYSTDPCSVNVLSSPSCPGYLDAINKNIPSTTTTNTVTSSPVVETSPTTVIVSSDISQPITSGSPTTAAPAVTPQATTSVSSTPSATNPQPKVGEVTASGSSAKTTMSTSQVLAIVRSEQTRIGNLETSTAQQAAEQAQSVSDKTQLDSLSISAATINQSQVGAQSAVAIATSGISAGSQNNNQSAMSNSVSSTQSASARTQSIYSLAPSSQSQTTTMIASVSPQVSYFTNRNEIFRAQEEPPRVEGIRFNSTNPIFNIFNTPPASQSNTQESQSTTTVNTNVKDNDAAIGISLEAIAKQPRGFDSYMGIIPDVAFYKLDEIYKSQKTVDNARALRQLSSDRLHQEMVNQQYRK